MKILSRDFSRGEKILLVILAIVLVGLGYYYFVDQPVRRNIAAKQAEKAALDVELQAVNAKVSDLERMQNELDDLSGVSYMPSYNSSKAETDFLNDVLSSTSLYTINFSDVSRDADLIRRNVSITFTVPSEDMVKPILTALSESENRCMLDAVHVQVNRNSDKRTVTNVTVTLTATFFETMVGGTADAGLPADEAAAS